MAQNPVSSNSRYVTLCALLPALGTGKSIFLPSPVDGVFKLISVGVNTAVDANNVITVEKDGTAVTGASITLTTAHTAGAYAHAVPTALNTIKRGQCLEVITDGGGGAGEIEVVLLIEQD